MKNYKQTLLVFFILILGAIMELKAQNSCNSFIKLSAGDLGEVSGGLYNNVKGGLDFDNSNNIYVAGKNNFFLSKYSSDGNLLWSKAKPGQSCSDVTVKDGFVFVTSNNAILAKYDTSGNELITPVVVPKATPVQITTDSLSNIYIVGRISQYDTVVFGSNIYTTSLQTVSYFIVKYNTNGQLIWSKQILPDVFFDLPIGISIHKGYLYAVSKYVQKYDLAGNFLTQSSGGSVSSELFGITSRGWLVNPQSNQFSFYGLTGQNHGYILEDCFVSWGGGLDRYSAYYDNNFASINAFYTWEINKTRFSLSIGNVLDTSELKHSFMRLPTDGEKRQLIGYNKSGELIGVFSVNKTQNNDTAFVDLAYVIPSASSQVLIVKFSTTGRVFPTNFGNESIDCGGTTQLGFVPTGIDDINPLDDCINTKKTSFLWSPSIGLSNPNIQNPIANPTTSTQYTVNVDGTCSYPVNVNVTNPTSFTYTTNGMVVSFSKTGNGCNSFLWDFGNGNTSNINPNPVVTYQTPGTYSICLQCNSQPSQCVKCVNINVPGNGSGGTTSVIDLNSTPKLNIFPNPADKHFYVNTKNQVNVLIYNLFGQVIWRGIGVENSPIDISQFLKGMYIVKIVETGQTFKLKKE